MKLISALWAGVLLFAACNSTAPKKEGEAPPTQVAEDSTVIKPESKTDLSYMGLAWGGLFKDEQTGKETLSIRALFKFRPTATICYNFMLCSNQGEPMLSIDYSYDKTVMEEYIASQETGELVKRKYQTSNTGQNTIVFSEESLSQPERDHLTKLLSAKETAFIPVVVSEIVHATNRQKETNANQPNPFTGLGRKLKKGKGWVTRNF